MKKILIYTDTPITGGAELQIFLLAKFLDKQQFQPQLICANYPSLDNWVEKFQKEQIPVHRLQVKNKRDLNHYHQLKQIIKQEKPDILHIHVWNPASCRHAFLAGNNTNTPIVTTEHDPFKLSFLKNLFKKYTLKSVKKIITVSTENQQTLKQLYPKHQEKIAVIHNGIDFTWWNSQLLSFNKLDRKTIKEELFHAKEDTLIITTIAALHERKGINYAIDALKPLTEQYPNIKLVIIGNGPEKENLQKQINKLKLTSNAILLGKQSNIPYLLKSSDIFLLPSKREAFGLVNLEAMFCGLPVVASKVGGIPEIIAHKKTGILVPAQNPQAITEALNQLISNPQLRKLIGENGQRHAISTFNAHKMAKAYQEIYQEITA